MELSFKPHGYQWESLESLLSTEILKSVTGVMVGDNLVQPGWDYPKVEETPPYNPRSRGGA